MTGLPRFVRQGILLVVGLLAVLVLKACSSGGGTTVGIAPPVATPPPPVATTFFQLERFGIPGLIEVYMDFVLHDTSNRATPVNDVALQESSIRSFVSAVGRPTGIADALVAVTLPDQMQADLSQSNGAYFGAELASLGVVPPNFGGRRIADDIVDVTLAVTFGDAVTGITEGVIPSLLTDNISVAPNASQPGFPYLTNPV